MLTRTTLNKFINKGDVSEKDGTTFFMGARSFFQESLQYAVTKMPFTDELLMNAELVYFEDREKLTTSMAHYFVQRYSVNCLTAAKIAKQSHFDLGIPPSNCATASWREFVVSWNKKKLKWAIDGATVIRPSIWLTAIRIQGGEEVFRDPWLGKILVRDSRIPNFECRDFQLLSPVMREFLTLILNLSNYQRRILLTSWFAKPERLVRDLWWTPPFKHRASCRSSTYFHVSA